MATTDIHAIKQTVGVALSYITKDKVEEKVKMILPTVSTMQSMTKQEKLLTKQFLLF